VSSCGFLTFEVIGIALPGGLDFLAWSLLGLFMKCVSDDYQLLAIKEAEEPIDVFGMFYSDFPKVMGAGHFLKYVIRGMICFFYEF